LSGQRTIAEPFEISGRGLFSGAEVTVRLKPAEPDTGIVFVRTDVPDPGRIPARIDYIAKRNRRTSLKNGVASVETIEHFMAAAIGLGVDNLEIELDAPELPGLDGSCLPVVEGLRNAGLVDQPAERRTFRITQPIHVAAGDASLDAVPADVDALDIVYDLEYGPDGPIGRQLHAVTLSPETFAEQIAGSRTFLLKAEAEQFRAAGLGTHLTYDDILVFGPDGPIENPVRWADECVRHKILDLIGDLALLGRGLRGRIYARKSGHSLNHELVRRLGEQLQQRQLAARLAAEPVLDIRRIQRVLPHRYPMLMIDRILELDGTRRAIAVKNVTINEEFFQGHYPGQPIMPGVLIIEAMAQLAGILLSQELQHTGKIAVLLSLDKVKLRRPVVPGDQLILEANAVRVKPRTGHCRCQARVGDALAAEAEIKFMMVDADPV